MLEHFTSVDLYGAAVHEKDGQRKNESGYMARAAFLMDRPMRALGLSGRSFIPLLLGFGCSVPAARG